MKTFKIVSFYKIPILTIFSDFLLWERFRNSFFEQKKYFRRISDTAVKLHPENGDAIF